MTSRHARDEMLHNAVTSPPHRKSVHAESAHTDSESTHPESLHTETLQTETLHESVRAEPPRSNHTGLTGGRIAVLPAGLSAALETVARDCGRGQGPGISLTVAPDPEAVTDARHFATAALEAWNMGTLADDVSLVVTELVTNALRHSLPPCPAEPAGLIRLRMICQLPYILCGIQDTAEQDLPSRREPDYIAETGRGLHIVESFSRAWGWVRFPGGKVVWALFRLPTQTGGAADWS
jgi:signal transduction histidine kinase